MRVGERFLFESKEESVLPSGYRGIDWCDTDFNGSSGAFVKTGITGLVRDTFVFEAKCVRTMSAGDWNFLVGAESSDNSYGYVKVRLYGGPPATAWEKNVNVAASVPCPLGVVQHVKVKNGVQNVNGTSWSVTSSSYTNNTELYIASAAWVGVNSSRVWPGLIGRVFIGSGSTSRGDFKPAVRLSDGAVGFYDFVGERFLTSSNPNKPFKEGSL